MTARRLAAVVLPLVLLALHCAPSTSTRTTGGGATPDLIQQSVLNNQQKVHSLKGSGNITIETPELAQSASFELMLRKPDSVLLKIEGPFGIEVGAALMTSREFLLYNSLQNRLISGSMNPSNLSRILRVSVSFEELIRLLTGGAFLAEDQRAPQAFTIEDDQYVLTYASPNGSRQYWVDPSTLLITKIQLFDGKRKPLFEQRFSRFRSVEGTPLPQHIRFLQPQERRAVALSFSSMSINSSNLHLFLDVPRNAQRVRWE